MSFTFDLTGWRESETSSLFDRLQETLATGGTVFGVWDSDALAGLASLDVKPVGGNPAIVKLDLLHVSAPYRNKGIGKQLTAMASKKASSLGATALYISATPSRNTVDAYLRMGGVLAYSRRRIQSCVQKNRKISIWCSRYLNRGSRWNDVNLDFDTRWQIQIAHIRATIFSIWHLACTIARADADHDIPLYNGG